MSELKPKKTPLKFKGQKPLTVPAKRFYHQVSPEPAQRNKTQQKALEKDKPEDQLPKGSPTKKVKVDEGQLPISIKGDKTAAELAFDLVKKKRLMKRIDQKMKLSHKERLDKYNKVLNSLPEHYDIHKIGEKIQKGY